MTLDDIKRLKKQYGYTNAQMAELSGLPLSTVQKVLGGTTGAPRRQTLEALASVFPRRDASDGVRYTYTASILPDHFSETQAAYTARILPVYPPGSDEEPPWPDQGNYTIEDYLALPDEQRVELIDGVFYDMSAPSIPHQLIGGAVYAQLVDFVRQRGGSCVPLMSPVDVQLNRDNKTMVQPDVMVVCDRSKISRSRVFGPPDLVVEVLSPSTRVKDIIVKMGKYRYAGVREYWMVDPEHESTTQVIFSSASDKSPDGDVQIRTYDFDQPVPVSIFGDECEINLREIAERYSFLSD